MTTFGRLFSVVAVTFATYYLFQGEFSFAAAWLANSWLAINLTQLNLLEQLVQTIAYQSELMEAQDDGDQIEFEIPD
jgi:hypothetical protein